MPKEMNGTKDGFMDIKAVLRTAEAYNNTSLCNLPPQRIV
jgi:hypothetical protein